MWLLQRRRLLHIRPIRWGEWETVTWFPTKELADTVCELVFDYADLDDFRVVGEQ